MGCSPSTQIANAPKAIIEVEVLDASNLAEAEHRIGDAVRGVISTVTSSFVDNSSFLSTARKPYVEVTVEGQTEKTTWVASKEDNGCAFGEMLQFPLYKPLSTFEALSLNVVVFDYRIFNGLRETPRIGWSTHNVALPCRGDMFNGVELQLRREGDDIKGTLQIRYRVRGLEQQYQVVNSPSEHSLADITKSVAPILMAGNGVDILIDNMPSALRLSVKSSSTKRDAVATLISTLNACATSVKSATDEEALVGLGELARKIILIIAENCSAQDDVALLAEEWISNVFALCAKESESQGPKLNKERLHKFISAAQVRPEDLMPATKEFQSFAPPKGLWTSLSVPADAKLGAGAYGCVWRAKDSYIGKMYAVKSLKVLKEGLLKVAERESQVASLLTSNPHPFIIKLFHHFHDPQSNMYFLVMEFCPNGDLNTQVEKWHKQSKESGKDYQCPPLANVWIAHIFLGLEHAHTKMDTLLRDVKPANVVIAENNVAKLTDFGFSRIGADHTGAFSFAAYSVPAPGSPAFVAPEVVLGQSYGPAADLYSFGVLIWVLLTGGLKGRTNIGEPPCATGWSGTNLRPLARNWRKLKQCIETPEVQDANELPVVKDGLVASLVLAMIERGIDVEPPLHAALRHLEFWKDMALPSSRSSLDEVLQWTLKSVAQS